MCQKAGRGPHSAFPLSRNPNTSFFRLTNVLALLPPLTPRPDPVLHFTLFGLRTQTSSGFPFWIGVDRYPPLPMRPLAWAGTTVFFMFVSPSLHLRGLTFFPLPLQNNLFFLRSRIGALNDTTFPSLPRPLLRSRVLLLPVSTDAEGSRS